MLVCTSKSWSRNRIHLLKKCHQPIHQTIFRNYDRNRCVAFFNKIKMKAKINENGLFRETDRMKDE